MSSNAPPTTTSPDRPSTNNPQALLITPNHIPVVTQTEENSPFQGREGSPKKTEHNDFFSCERSLSMLTGRRYQKTCSPLAEGTTVQNRVFRISPKMARTCKKVGEWGFRVDFNSNPHKTKFVLWGLELKSTLDPHYQPFYRFSPFSVKSEKPCFEPSCRGGHHSRFSVSLVCWCCG
jgi:hypothetical protein